MEDLEKYLKILNSERCVKTPREAAIILDMISECFNLEKSQFTIGLLISLVLDENDSIFTFIWKTCGDFETVSSVTRAFKLLHYLVNSFQKSSESYFCVIFKKCLYLLDAKFAKIKEASLKLIRNLIEADSRHSLDLSELVLKLEKHLKEETKISKIVSDQILSLLGYLFQKFPESIKNEKWFFNKMFITLTRESEASKPSIDSVKAALEGINGYLTSHSITNLNTLKKTYEYMKSWSKFREERKAAGRASLNALQSHWKHFSSFIYNDREFWRLNMEIWINQKSGDRQFAFKFLCSFYSVIAFFIKQNSNASELDSYTKELVNTLESNANPLEKTAALVGIRYFVLTDSLTGDRFYTTYEHLVKFIRKEEAFKDFSYLPLCVECVSAFALKFTDQNFFMEQLALLQRLSVRLIESYPSSDVELQQKMEVALEKSFYTLGFSSLDDMKNHIVKVLYQGLIRTCSKHTLAEVELSKETGQTPIPVSYKSYLNLWRYLLNLASSPNLPIEGSFTLKKGVAVNVFDAFIESFLKIILKLNFSVGLEMEVEKPNDLHIFINMVDLYQDVIPSTDFFNLQKWLMDIFGTVICLSYKYPLVSGFYTVTAVNLKVADSIEFFEDLTKEKEKCFELVKEFLRGILLKIDHYKGDLRMACFRVLLSAPVVLIGDFAEETVPVLEEIARFARSSFPLLKDLIEALERWDLYLPPATSCVIMEKILPFFDIFFQSPYFRGNDSVGYSNEGKKLKVEVVFNDSELLTLQKKFLIFLGHMELKKGMSLIQVPDSEERRRISDKQLVYSLPYNKGWVEMNLEEIIPRVVDLAESCGDRDTRLIACELLHSMALLILGNINQLSGGYTYLFGKVMRTCLMLGCDSDGLVCQIFEPLMFQVVHYVSGKWALHLTERSDLIDMLLENVTCQYNSTVRDFAGVLLRDFIAWSIKQTSPEQLRTTPESIESILQRIYSLAMHPSHNKRLGAAVAFNKIYSILREEEFILDAYWFQLYYYFFESLRMCEGPEDVTEITEAIKHLERPLMEKHDEFNKESPDRIIPPEFKGGRLCHLVKWTMDLAIDVKTTVRHIAMRLFEKLAPLVKNCDSNIQFVSNQLQDFLQDVEKEHSQTSFTEEGFVRWLKAQTAGFEYCTWLLEQRVIKTEEILQPVFKEVLKRFISTVMLNRQKQSAEIDRHKQESVLTVLMLLFALRERAYMLPREQWELLQTAVFKPSEFGFDLYNVQNTERLHSLLTDLLKFLMSHVTAYDLDKFYENLESIIIPPQFGKIVKSRYVSVENLEFLFSLKVVESAGAWKDFASRVFFSLQEDHFIVPIFRSLFYSEGKTVYAVSLEPRCKLYLEEFLSVMLKMSPDLKVLNFFEKEEEVKEVETGKTVKKGEFFKMLFKNTIFKFLENNADLVIDWTLKQRTDKGVQFLIQILENQAEDPRLPHKIFLRWEEFENVKINDAGLKNKALLRLAVCGGRVLGEPGFLKRSPVADKIYTILKSQNFYDMDFAEVETIFNLLPFLSSFGEDLNENDRLQECLSKIEIEPNSPKSEGALKQLFVLKESLGTSKLNRVHFAFGELLRSLKITGSLVILNFLLSKTPWVSGICKREDVERSLSVFADDQDHALKALQLAYDHCFNEEISYSPLVVFEFFLHPLMRISPGQAIYQLVNKNFGSLIASVTKHWGDDKNVTKISKNLLRSMCAAQVIQTFFIKTTKEDLNGIPRERRQEMDEIVKKVFFFLKQPPPPNVLRECHRKLMCHIFNMVCCIISARCLDEKFYKLFIFDERGGFLFEVVDSRETHNLSMCFNEIPKRRKHLTMLREAIAEENPAKESVKYIHTNTLFTSSLQEDVRRFDFTSALIRPKSAEPQEPSKNVEIELEMDAFNSHDCMATLVATISKMVQDKIKPLDGGLPCWLKFFLNVLRNLEFSENLRLFILKAMYNVQDFLAPFAKDIFPDVLSAILKLFTNYPINYFLFDWIEVMIGWRHVPDDEKSRLELTELVVLVLEKSDSFRRDIMSGNLECLKTMIEVWKGGLILPKLSECVFKRFCQSMQEDLKSNNSITVGASYLNVQVCGILLSNGIPAWEEDSEKLFFHMILKGFHEKNKHSELFGEVCGLALNYIEKNKPEDLNEPEQLIRSKINSLTGCWVRILYAVHKHHPRMSSFFGLRILSSAWDSSDSLTVKKLKMLVRQSEDPVLERLAFAFITDKLNSPDVAVQEVTLEIAGKLLHALDIEKMKDLMKIVLRLQKSSYPGVRKQVYEISKKLYQTGRNDVIGLLCRVILLRGLCDDVKELEDSCFAFWQGVFATTNFAFLHIIREMYTPETEDIFLSNTAKVLLHLAGEDHNSRNKVFQHPITLQCKFRKRNLILGTRQSLLLSLASSGRSLANQSLENLATLRRQHVPYLRPTPSSLAFQPTVEDNAEDATMDVVTPKETLVPKNPFKRRFSKNEATVNFIPAKKRRTNEENQQKKEDEVVIYGEYRDGEYPDIQVSHAQVIKLMEALATRDPQIARLFLVSFYSGLIKTFADDEKQKMLSKTSKCFENMLKSSENYDPGVFGFVLQVILNHHEDLNIDCHLISNAAVSSNWTSLGALILEQVLTRKEEDAEEEAPKRRRGEDDPKEKTWLDLAKLYRELKEFDVLSGIFLDKLNASTEGKEAIRCETAGDWQDALQHYVSVLQSNPNASQKEFYTEAYLSCLAKLSSWSSMNKCIRATVNDDLEKLWENYYLLSWFIRSEVMISLGTDRNDFRDIFGQFCVSPAKRNILSTNFGEEMTVFDWFSGNFQRANFRIDKLCLDFLAGWSHLDRWSYKLRAAKLASLQTLSELSFVASNLADVRRSQVEHNIKLGERRWKKNFPDQSDDLTIWDVKLGYRRELFKHLKEFDLARLDVKANLSLAKAALSQNNLSQTKECLSRAKEKLSEGDFDLKMEHHAYFNLGKMVVARMKLKDPNLGLKVYLKVWDEISEQISSGVEAKSHKTLLYNCSFILGQLVSEILPFVENETVFPEIISLIEARLGAVGDVKTALRQRGLDYFTTASRAMEGTNSETQSNIHLEIAKFALKFQNGDCFEILCKSLLKSMALGNADARELFGCVLNLSHLFPDGASCQDLISHANDVPSWMFLAWINQMFACLNSKMYPFLRRVLLRLAEDYPTPIRYASRVMDDAKSKEPATKLFFGELQSALPQDPLFNNFWDSMKYLAPPHVILKNSLEEALDELEQTKPDFSRINKIISDLNQLMFSTGYRSFRGPIFQFCQKFKESLEDLLIDSEDREAFKTKIKVLLGSIGNSKMPSKRSCALLMSYSPWLYNFHALKVGTALELPGQYDGRRPPPAKPVTIFSFRNEVLLFDSKSKPMRIGILGNDAKEHKFLIKFGEDLRQDERIQRVFQHFNHRLRENRHTRTFHIDTYKVVPLTQNLGMIEWVEDNVSLFEMLENSLGGDSDAIAKAQKDHLSFLGQGVTTSGWEVVTTQLRAYRCVSRHRAVSNFRAQVQSFPRDLLRKSFLDLSTSPQHFIYLRGNLATSHAVLCVVHWLIGIGDRHLQNVLISTKTGRVLGIDFGYAFGFATQFLALPELTPFRLTPQILNLMRPLGESGWIKQTMIRCLRVFRKDTFRLRSVLEVFAEEPVMDWLKQARKNPNRTAGSLERWYPREKLSLVESKLNGANPVVALEADLWAGHSQSEHLEKFLEVLKGDPQYNIRARCGMEGLSEEDQVECLIDLATDVHILSKTYVGWNPWL